MTGKLICIVLCSHVVLCDVKVTLHSSHFVLLYLLGTKTNEPSAIINNLHDTTSRPRACV